MDVTLPPHPDAAMSLGLANTKTRPADDNDNHTQPFDEHDTLISPPPGVIRFVFGTSLSCPQATFEMAPQEPLTPVHFFSHGSTMMLGEESKSATYWKACGDAALANGAEHVIMMVYLQIPGSKAPH
jgi:hypothetical protein